MIENKRVLNTYITSGYKLKFGDYILFQKYTPKDDQYEVSKPILAIYLNCFVADQTIGFNYIVWNNDNHTISISIDGVMHKYNQEVEQIDNHVEWMEYIDILGYWENRPNWKQIIKAYRKQNTKEVIDNNEFEVIYGVDKKLHKMIDISKLVYGQDFYALPPRTIVYIRPEAEILNLLDIDRIDGEYYVRLDEDDVPYLNDVVFDNKGFEFNLIINK